ncbi:MAG: glycosyltransferase 87 family protein, partial [Actinomycetota bacterium]
GWSDGRQYRLLCYSDIVPLLYTEQLDGNRLPFLQPCLESGGPCDEYPVLTMYAMRVAAWVGGSTTLGFFMANAIFLWVCAAAVATFLYMLGGRALWFALAPTLLIYAFMNWDLFAVALATGALLAFARRRDGLAGVLLGVGAAAKLYPAMLLIPLIAQRLREREPDSAIRIGWATAGTWLLANAPFAIASPSSWSTFFRFNSARPADWDSLWYLGCTHVDVTSICGHTSRINVASLALFTTTFLLVWMWKQRREPQFARWSLAFPMLVLFLLSNKVYSPQYGLWLLPFFALGAIDLRTFVAFEAADVAVFVTRFSYFGELTGVGGLPFGAFEIAIAVRTLILLWCVVAWVRRPTVELPELEAIDLGAQVAPAGAPA